jgi:hypothetical protein
MVDALESLRVPPKAPMAVRQADTMTTSFMSNSCFGVPGQGGRCRRRRRPNDRVDRTRGAVAGCRWSCHSPFSFMDVERKCNALLLAHIPAKINTAGRCAQGKCM